MTEPTEALTESPSPSTPGGRLGSVSYVRSHWYVLCESRELRTTPLSRRLMGTPLVVFRDEQGRPGVLLDRCAHRNVPLSLGRCVGDHLQCAYHGWAFDRQGVCQEVPGLCTDAPHRARAVPAYAAREQDGYLWVWGTPDVEPTRPIPAIQCLGADGYTVVRRTVEFEATVHATVENALDVPHTAFLHRGLFRGAREPVEVRAVVTRDTEGVQVEYLDEPRPPGLAGRLLSPSGGVVTHFDRFRLPSIAEVEYRLGDENHFVVTSLCTPVDDFLTRVFAVVTFRLRLPGWLVKPVLTPIALKIFGQDAWILKEQTDAIHRFGGERFTSTDLDLIGAQVWRLLRREEQGRTPDPHDEWRKEVTFRV